jgi:hypothetical protein
MVVYIIPFKQPLTYEIFSTTKHVDKQYEINLRNACKGHMGTMGTT